MMKKVLSIALLMVPCVVSAMDVERHTKTKMKPCTVILPQVLRKANAKGALLFTQKRPILKIRHSGKKYEYPMDPWRNLDREMCEQYTDNQNLKSFLSNKTVKVIQNKVTKEFSLELTSEKSPA